MYEGQLITRDEVDHYLLAVLDMRKDLATIRRILEEDDGEISEDDA